MMALTYSLRPATGFHGQLILNVGARRSGIKDSLLLTAGIIGGCPRLLHFLNSSSALARWLTAASIFRSEEHTSELQSLMRISYAAFCLKKKKLHRHKKKT